MSNHHDDSDYIPVPKHLITPVLFAAYVDLIDSYDALLSADEGMGKEKMLEILEKKNAIGAISMHLFKDEPPLMDINSD